MSDYPRDRATRASRRRENDKRVMAQAAITAAKTARSYKCGLGLHAPHGCQNDGSGCLCECHDG